MSMESRRPIPALAGCLGSKQAIPMESCCSGQDESSTVEQRSATHQYMFVRRQHRPGLVVGHWRSTAVKARVVRLLP